MIVQYESIDKDLKEEIVREKREKKKRRNSPGKMKMKLAASAPR